MAGSQILLIGLVVVVIMAGAIIWAYAQTRKKSLMPTNQEQPDWVRSTPPAETLAATKADNENFQLFDHDTGEKLASPFAEQIEDIFAAMIQKDPSLASYKIDLGTAPGGELEIWVNDKKYDSADSLPDPRLKELFQAAVEKWNKN